MGEIGEDELYALLREHWVGDGAGASDSGHDPYGGLSQIEEVVCTELTTWCGGTKGPKSKNKNKNKNKSKVKKQKLKKHRQKKKGSPNE